MWPGAALVKTILAKATGGKVSRQPERSILHGGSKTLTAETSGPDGFALIVAPEARIVSPSGEHSILDLTVCGDGGPPIGEVVHVVPNHVCVALNTADCCVAVRGEEIIGEIPVAARGSAG